MAMQLKIEHIITLTIYNEGAYIKEATFRQVTVDKKRIQTFEEVLGNTASNG